MNAPVKSPDVDIVTFGCRLNLVDSETIRRAAREAGTDRPFVVVNTCAVTNEAVRQARQTIRRMRRERPEARIVVTGCAAQIESAGFAAMPEVDHVLGNAEKRRPEVWAALSSDAAARVAVGPIDDIGRDAPFSVGEAADGRTRALIEVQNGCDHRCTFCIIPFGRGPSRSAPVQEVVTRARRLAQAGQREIVLTGVDLTSWGADMPDAPRLGSLLGTLLREVPEITRLRLSSIDCIEADADLFDLMASEPRLMPHLHLSLQAGDDMILKRMKRRHTRADAIDFCATLRRLRPEIAFGADIIVGFPTETEEMFARSLDMVDACGLTFLHVFPFSPRQGTPAARMPQVASGIARERAARLREKGNAALSAHLDRHVGRKLTVLAEKGGLGRAPDFTPFRTPGVEAGSFLELTASGHDGHALHAS